ncbi:MAG: DNA-binding protein [Eubacteriales bacterium]|nr:DNA-binding protein [Eubacteriales bacterium]
MNVNYVMIPEVAARYALEPQTVRRLCEEHRIEGAVRFGRTWAIPDNVTFEQLRTALRQDPPQ